MSLVKSPLNYTGGKYKLLSQILKFFPKEIDTFVDLFGGGFNVGVNVKANKVIYNDQIDYLVEIFEYFKKHDIDLLLEEINHLINEFDLSLFNQKGYNQLRSEYNSSKSPMKLFTLTCYSFNHQIRFNSKHEFNAPFGINRSCFNDRIKNNLIRFCNQLKSKDVEFSNLSFENFRVTDLNSKDLVYCDPPYLITTGSYNDGKRGFNGWTETEELLLLQFLDTLDELGVKFALSNVLEHKGVKNQILIEWSKKYNVHRIDSNYENSNYQSKNTEFKSLEVLITNYNLVEEGNQIEVEQLQFIRW
jgi:DNA adenine methylase